MLTLLAALTTAHAQIMPPPPVFPTDAIALWGGFNHFWDNTNHRVQRLGSWVENGSCGASLCDAALFATAATGTGDDDANNIGRFTQVRTAAAGFDNGSHTSSMFGAEGSEIIETFTVNRTLPAALRGKSNYVAVINGFDLKMTDGSSLPIPDKLGHLRIDFDDVTYNPTTHVASFDVEVRLRMDCDSAECSIWGSFDNLVEYDLEVQWVIVGGNSTFHYEVETESDGLIDDYGWDEYNSSFVCSSFWPCPENEIFLADHTIAQTLEGPTGYNKAATAFSFLDVELDSEEGDEGMYLWSLALQMKSPSYHASTGDMDVDVDLFAKEWTAWDIAANPASVGHSGDARVKADVVLLQFADGTVTTGSRTSFFPQDEAHEEEFSIDF